MVERQKTGVAIAEFVGGPFDGYEFVVMPGVKFPEFVDRGLGPQFPISDSAVARHGGTPRNCRKDCRRALYRFEPLANGTMQYVFDRRYNR
jgi:hypothetical protein